MLQQIQKLKHQNFLNCEKARGGALFRSLKSFDVSSLNLLRRRWGTGGWGEGEKRNKSDGVVGVEWGGGDFKHLFNLYLYLCL